MTVTMVVQFGEATMPRWVRTACALISGTTSGTSGSIRNALDLSTTVAPAATRRGAISRDWAEPAEQNAISTPLKADASTRRTGRASPRKVTVLPTERSEAKQRSSPTGNFRSSRMRRVICPAAPVAPTTATRTPLGISPLQRAHDQVAHLAGAHRLAAGLGDVARAVAVLEHPPHRPLDAIGVVDPVQRVAQQHRRR